MKKKRNTKRLHKCAEPNSKTEDVYIGLMFEQEMLFIIEYYCWY